MAALTLYSCRSVIPHIKRVASASYNSLSIRSFSSEADINVDNVPKMKRHTFTGYENEILSEPCTVQDLPPSKGTAPKYVESTEEYKWVERLLPTKLIPRVKPNLPRQMPSGWAPPPEKKPDLPYFVGRNRVYEYNVRHEVRHQTRNITQIRKVDGDIWALEKDVRDYLEAMVDYPVATQVHEVTRMVRVKGYFVEEIKQFLFEKGF
ncbi:PREDICTED: 39S ribosomal protein L49, mitochondrial-like isoform X2 [Priapulus caudatus]|uniref:Large ribosomal subunit protein mL49 n=1 Tax=Priapulus caudatus TaxID=37621 RepID=A0ABM1EFW3_PRICU|nr:PREDICTED: 39S ribosomal protein L49, mitochondrial-like isoform X2 [Priapulus caudatus]